ncbi:serine/arginine-rich splicing factor 11-like isoform X1 [Sitophilus oryzae]|uniref:Serine/arginine-rich splicing factor 11-like isoform X1 n=1 Tax=Sitophilus oryzae TaxID=7048 RepID=A0A6J2YMQ1_SITOR|nr:serine/arginine-rich splicing factor 11-like isoform X1 [Sitophilus oryzae]
MKRVGKEPRLLPNVMEAIAHLKEKRGSTQKQIIEHLAHLLKKGNAVRNVTMQVRRALEHGINSGLIKQKGGKYSLGLDKRDYAIFRRFRQIDEPLECSHKRRRGRGRRGRRRRRSRSRRRHRRRALSVEHAGTDDSESARSVNDDNTEPMDRGRRRRRRRRGRKGRRRGRRGRRHAEAKEVSSSSSESAKNEKKESPPNIVPEKRKSDQEKIDFHSKSGNSQNHQSSHSQDRNQAQEEDDIDCGNPECLCNIKQEDDLNRCMSRDDYYHDSYLN